VMLRVTLLGCLALATAAISPCQAAILNFDDLSFSDYDPVPSGYGSGLDPNISISYRSIDVGSDLADPSDDTTAGSFLLWNTGYGDLSKVGFASQQGRAAELTFTPDSGFDVYLQDFDMATWGSNELNMKYLRIWNSDYSSLLYEQTDELVGAGATHSTMTIDQAFSGSIHLQWGTDWNIGIDNIKFSSIESNAVPEPASMSIWGLGALGCAVAAFRRRLTAA